MTKADLGELVADDYWASRIRRIGSNSLTDAWMTISEFVDQHTDPANLRSLAATFRSLEARARDRAAALKSRSIKKGAGRDRGE